MDENQVHKYDRTYGRIIDVALHTKPSTVKLTQPITGRSETYIIQTARMEDGDYIFVELADEEGLKRMVLPPKVARAIASQASSLTKRSRSRAARITMANRMAAGEVIGFKKKQG